MASYSRSQLRDALQNGCAWDASALDQAITKRFPGKGRVDLGELMDAWVDDESLSVATLCHCVSFAGRLSGQSHMPVFGFTVKTDEQLRDELQRLRDGL